MTAVIVLLLIVLVALLINRIATMALMATGMSRQVQENDWMADRTLSQMHLRDEGVIVLGIERGGEFVGTPNGDSLIKAGDTLVVYGRFEALSNLDDRRKGPGGELSHVDQVIEHRVRARAERAEEQPGGPCT